MIYELEVLWGVNNIYSLIDINSGLKYEGLIKGKVLNTSDKEYSPLVPGDIVSGEIYDNNKVYIKNRVKRANVLWRYNKKIGVKQSIAANIDNILIVNSSSLPEIKNSFIDRALLISEYENINPIIIINKIDEGISEETKNLVDIYKFLSYKIIFTSTVNGNGISELKEVVSTSRSVFLGQSGVGKSSLMNLLDKDISQKTSEISSRYKRGRHTTVYSIAHHTLNGIIIDTPGIKEFSIETFDFELLKYYFVEFKDLNSLCKFNSCLHESEPECAVKNEVNKKISLVRYESYLKILGELKRYKEKYGK